MPKVYNARTDSIPSGAVLVDRSTPFGNFAGQGKTRSDAVRAFRYEVESDEEYREYIVKKLKGSDLVCWCSPYECHADVLLEIANCV